jgi:threonine dehydratase
VTATAAAAATACGCSLPPLQVAGGQGTLALELLMQLRADQLDTVFVPVGGGGLVSGVAAVLKAASPGIHVVGCQPQASDVMRRSVDEGRVVELEWRETLSDATAGGCN